MTLGYHKRDQCLDLRNVVISRDINLSNVVMNAVGISWTHTRTRN